MTTPLLADYPTGSIAQQVCDYLAALTAPLHPDTDPAAIAAAQRACVRAALRSRPGADPAALSDLTDLPANVVARRLAEIGRTGSGSPPRSG